MRTEAAKDVLYGGITEMMRNPKFYRFSTVDAKYSEWTDDGKIALRDFISEMCPLIDKAERDALIKRAEELTMSALKK